MSSHKEAPGIAKDPVADSTDVYAFVSPDAPETVTIIANYVPLQDPGSGPNFAEFGAKTSVQGGTPTGDDVQYNINIVNTDTGLPAITYQFTFLTEISDTTTFLYNTGPITYANDAYSTTWNRQQTYTINRIDTVTTGALAGQQTTTPLVSASGLNKLACPPCNVGVRSTPNYQTLSAPAVYTLSTGEKVFAGQRAEGFFVDLGAIFDLGDVRPLSAYQAFQPNTASTPVNSLATKNVHSIALQIPIMSLTSTGVAPKNASDPVACIGVYTTAARQTVRMFNSATGVTTPSGNYNQVSRLGNPLVNEAVVPMASKDYFNSQPPVNDSQFAGPVENPELQTLLVELYQADGAGGGTTIFPNLKAFIASGQPRTDLVAIFATGIPGSVFANGTSPLGTQGTAIGAGTHISEVLRLNMAVKPTTADGTGTAASGATTSNLGLLGGDYAGFPNGRRPTDDIVTIELMAVAGATIPLTYPTTYTADTTSIAAIQGSGTGSSARSYQPAFPYLADPHSGFYNPTVTPTPAAASVDDT